jgi:hypothetical protein
LTIEIVIYFKPSLVPEVIRSEYFLSDVAFAPGTVPDPNVGYKYAPNISIKIPFEKQSYTLTTTVVYDPDTGFRDDGINGQPYAIVVGDSVTACIGVNLENCWVELLEHKTGQDFANLGVTGYGPDLQFRMLKYYGLPLKPKVVLWVFFANDMIQGWRFNQFGQGAITEGEFWKNPVASWLAKHSAIYLTLAYFWYERNFFRYVYSNEPAVAGNSELAWWLAYSDLTIPEVTEGFERTKNLILEASQLSQSELDNTQFIVVIIPFHEQISYTGTEYQSLFDTPSKALLNFGQQNDILVLDLTTSVREQMQQEGQELYFKDGHLNIQGNDIVAEILTQELKLDLPSLGD